jgi:hypothetical protein
MSLSTLTITVEIPSDPSPRISEERRSEVVALRSPIPSDSEEPEDTRSALYSTVINITVFNFLDMSYPI